MAVSQAQMKANRRYDLKNIKGLYLKLNKKTDADILAFLETVDSKNGIIKHALREHMEKAKTETNH